MLSTPFYGQSFWKTSGELPQPISLFYTVISISWGGRSWHLERGVPQGSILGPLLWNIAFDGILCIPLPAIIQIIAFANDLAILATHREAPVLEQRLAEAIVHVDTWLQERGLEIALDKSRAIYPACRGEAAAEATPRVTIC